MKPMQDAPRNGTSFVVLTPAAAHEAEWDAQFQNFWSITAERALSEDECVGWMSALEWKAFVIGEKTPAR